jgi:hypothetical protein
MKYLRVLYDHCFGTGPSSIRDRMGQGIQELTRIHTQTCPVCGHKTVGDGSLSWSVIPEKQFRIWPTFMAFPYIQLPLFHDLKHTAVEFRGFLAKWAKKLNPEGGMFWIFWSQADVLRQTSVLQVAVMHVAEINMGNQEFKDLNSPPSRHFPRRVILKSFKEFAVHEIMSC